MLCFITSHKEMIYLLEYRISEDRSDSLDDCVLSSSNQSTKSSDICEVKKKGK